MRRRGGAARRRREDATRVTAIVLGEMLAEVARYRELAKSNWVPADRNAFRAHAQWTERCGAGGTLPPERWALLQIAVRMAFLMRSTVWMTDADAERFAAMLATAAGDDDADSRAQAPMCFVDRLCCRALTARFSSRPGGDVFRAAARAPRRRGGGDGAVRARPLPLASAGRSLARLWRVQPDSPDPT